MRIAVVDLGTNSTRLLIADVNAEGRLEELERRTDVTRLGEGVDATGRLSDEAMERVHERLGAYRQLADEHEAQRRVAVATSAVRDATNGAAFRAAVERRHGFTTEVISGDLEAQLTFRGATAGREGGPTLVFDIGGGSTEYVVGFPGEAPSFHTSTRIGSVRHTERHLHSDPPTREELEELAAAVAGVVAAGVPEGLRRATEEGIAVAGTATSLAAIDQALEPYDPARVHGYRAHSGRGGADSHGARRGHRGGPQTGDRTATRACPHDRGRGGDPDRVDARVRPGRGRGERGRHPPWRGVVRGSQKGEDRVRRK